MTYRLLDKSSGAPIGNVSDEDMQFLVDELEEESSRDRDGRDARLQRRQPVDGGDVAACSRQLGGHRHRLGKTAVSNPDDFPYATGAQPVARALLCVMMRTPARMTTMAPIAWALKRSPPSNAPKAIASGGLT